MKTRKFIGEMVFCQSCKTVVWAQDWSVNHDLRGIMNMFRMPCRLCGAIGNFDGFNPTFDNVRGIGRIDGWATMREIAEANELKWNPSGTNAWFSDGINETIKDAVFYE
jgi:hypothetical protein